MAPAYLWANGLGQCPACGASGSLPTNLSTTPMTAVYSGNSRQKNGSSSVCRRVRNNTVRFSDVPGLNSNTSVSYAQQLTPDSVGVLISLTPTPPSAECSDLVAGVMLLCVVAGATTKFQSPSLCLPSALLTTYPAQITHYNYSPINYQAPTSYHTHYRQGVCCIRPISYRLLVN